MAGITSDQAIVAILKTYYKDGVENLLFRNSPLLKQIKRTRVEGKEQRFAALYSRGGAVAGDFLEAEKVSAQNVKNAEFVVVPGQLFSVFTYNAKEVQASLSKRGAYMKVAGNKAFAATEAFRKTLAASAYGRGYGEIAVLPASIALSTTAVSVQLPEDAIMKIDVGSVLDVKPSISADENNISITVTVTAIDGDTATLVAASGSYTTVAGDILALHGSVASGAPLLPIGLDSWFPIVEGRDPNGSVWPTFIATDFNGVKRSLNVEGLAGNFVDGSAASTIKETVEKLLQKCRRRGLTNEAAIVVMNDSDFLAFSDEIQSTNTYFTATSSKQAKRHAAVGFASASAAFSTNSISNFIDDPFCPKGKMYILDMDAVELWTYTNADSVEDGVANNQPGKQDVEDFNSKGKENDPYKLLIDDFITAEPGTATSNGPAVRVTLNFFGSLVVTNPATGGVALLNTATPANVIGYTL